jgi:hypothetical protein
VDAVLDVAGHDMASEQISADDLEPESVRLAGDLVEMVRYICFHTRDGKKRLKLTKYLDSLLRSPVTRDYAATRKRVLQEERGRKNEP